jgi:predicted XRE-type DNA-binding protein
MSKAKGINKPSHRTKGSIFDDLGLSAEEVREAKVKADLWRDLVGHITPLRLTQKELAKTLQVHQPDVSNLLSGKLSKFSVDALVGYAIRLGLGVEARITAPRVRQKGTIKAVQAEHARPKRSQRSALAGAA